MSTPDRDAVAKCIAAALSNKELQGVDRPGGEPYTFTAQPSTNFRGDHGVRVEVVHPSGVAVSTYFLILELQ